MLDHHLDSLVGDLSEFGLSSSESLAYEGSRLEQVLVENPAEGAHISLIRRPNGVVSEGRMKAVCHDVWVGGLNHQHLQVHIQRFEDLPGGRLCELLYPSLLVLHDEIST